MLEQSLLMLPDKTVITSIKKDGISKEINKLQLRILMIFWNN